MATTSQSPSEAVAKGPRSDDGGVATRRRQERSAAHSTFRVVYALLTLFYGGLGVSYLVDPDRAVRAFSRGNQVLGGIALTVPDAPPWRYATAVGMTTLGLMCLLLLIDLRRNYPILIPAAFFKVYNAVLWFAYFARSRFPVFLAAGLLDLLLVALMVTVARRAHARLGEEPVSATGTGASPFVR